MLGPFLLFTVIVKKENRQLNEIERHLLQKMRDLPEFRKFADELLLELIATSTIQPRSEQEINQICISLYEGLERAEETAHSKHRLN